MCTGDKYSPDYVEKVDYESWQQMIDEFHDEIIACTLSAEEMKNEFYAGYGMPEGKPFNAWSEKYVYFPVCYDGAESVGRAPRNPCKESNEHVGGY